MPIDPSSPSSEPESTPNTLTAQPPKLIRPSNRHSLSPEQSQPDPATTFGSDLQTLKLLPLSPAMRIP